VTAFVPFFLSVQGLESRSILSLIRIKWLWLALVQNQTLRSVSFKSITIFDVKELAVLLLAIARHWIFIPMICHFNMVYCTVRNKEKSVVSKVAVHLFSFHVWNTEGSWSFESFSNLASVVSILYNKAVSDMASHAGGKLGDIFLPLLNILKSISSQIPLV